MKKMLLYFLFVIFSYNLPAQSYYPMLDSVSNIWSYTSNLVPVKSAAPSLTNCTYPVFNFFSSNFLSTNGDTVIGSVAYKKLEQLYPSIMTGMDCHFGYIREDTTARKVYFRDNTLAPEFLLYDFSLQVGDSIYYDFLLNGGYYSTGWFKVDSIVNINVMAGTRRAFFLKNYSAVSQPYTPMVWIESVGHPGHLVFTLTDNSSWGGGLFFMCNDFLNRDYGQQLICFEHNSQKVFFDSCAHSWAYNNFCFDYEDSCSFWNICGSLEELGNVYQWRLSPNPVQQQLTLHIESAQKDKIHVLFYDLRGVRIKEEDIDVIPGMNDASVDCSALPSGLYVAEVNGSRKKFAVSR